MRTPKFKAQPKNAFFAAVNQMFGGSSLLATTTERAVIKSNRWAQFRWHSRRLGRAAEHLKETKNAFVGWALNFGVCMLFKSAVTHRLLELYAKNKFFGNSRFSGWISAKLALIQSKMHLQHDSLPFLPLVSHSGSGMRWNKIFLKR